LNPAARPTLVLIFSGFRLPTICAASWTSSMRVSGCAQEQGR
jgi:hypothetical protein